MKAGVEVTTTARLHLGFLDLGSTHARHFGSIGLSLDRPRTVVCLARARRTRVWGEEADRAGAYLARLLAEQGRRGAYSLAVEQSIPAHAGLGSGTQLGLAVGAALRSLRGEAAASAEDARLLDRGLRSGIGIALFGQGGLVVDGGHKVGGREGKGLVPEMPPLLLRHAVPSSWRVLLVLDRAHQGLSGTAERKAFASLPAQPSEAAAEACRLVLMQALPALIEDDLPLFGDAIAALQRIVGDHFAPAQGGRFASPRVASALAFLAEAGAHGIGQSSWGPTGFAFAREAEAEALADRLRDEGACNGLDIMVCRVRNRGAKVAALPHHASG